MLVDNWISSNIPDEGYTPGATYTITAYNNESGATRFGFEVSPQSISGKYLGKMIITDSVRTKIVSFSNQSGTPVEYITYTENGVDGLGESSWTFDWIAPASGTGEVTFYGGFNSNFEGHKEGDKTYLSTLTVKEKGSSIGSLSKTSLAYMHYPNPCNGPLSISFTIAKKEDVTIGLYDLQGKLVQTLFKQTVSGRQHIEVQIDQRIAVGNYAVRTKVGHKYYSEALLIQ